MTVAYTDRTTPLAANGSNTLAASIRLAYDFTGMGSLAEGAPYISQAASTLVKSGTINAVTVNGIPGRCPGTGGVYQFSGNGSADYGLNVGAGDFTALILVSTGDSLPAATASTTLLQVDNAGATSVVSVSWNEITTGWYISGTPFGASSANTVYGINTTVLIVVRRIAGVLSLFSAAVGPAATMNRRFVDVANAVAWDSSSAKRIRVCYTAGTAPTKSAIHNVRFLNVALTDAQMQTVARDPWALDANAAVADALTITSPAAGSTVASTTTISGTYTGTPPTGAQAQHGVGTWTALTAFVATPTGPGAGTWSGSVALPAASAAALRVRDANNNAIVSADVASITVAADAIAFTVPMIPFTETVDTQNGAVPYRLFQAGGSNQATARITGTYTGSPTGIQWRYNGGAWATLVASPSGGTFDATVTLQGPAQGALEVRFANSTAVSAALTAVGVGDIYIPIGQSNNVGKGTSYVPPVPPDANPSWVAVIRDKTGAWRPNVETSVQPFDGVTAGTAIYSAHETGGPAFGLGSYFGNLATRRMAEGVPVAFVPCALGSTSLAGWQPGQPLHNAFIGTAAAIGDFKGAMLWQGEAEAASAGTVQATQESGLNAIANDFAARFPGKQFILLNINTVGVNAAGAAAVRAAIAKVARTNANVSGYGDMLGKFAASIHYGDGGQSEVLAVAAEAHNAITAGAPVGVSKVSDLTHAGSVGNALSVSIANCFTGSFRRTGYAVTSGSLTPLALDATTGLLTGSPSAVGQLTAVVTATDLSGATATATVTVNVAATADTVPPSWPAGAAIELSGLAQTSYTATAPTATDDVGVTSYRWRVNGGTWTAGQVASITGRTPGSTDTVEFQAGDGTNWSVSLTRSVTLQPSQATATTASVTLTSDGTTPVPGLTGLSYYVIAGAPGSLGSVIAQSANGGTTNASGGLSVNIAAANLALGAAVEMVVRHPTTNFGWAGPAVVM